MHPRRAPEPRTQMSRSCVSNHSSSRESTMSVYSCSRWHCVVVRFTRRSAVLLAMTAPILPRLATAQNSAKLHITDDTVRRELLVEVGPMDLPAHMSHHNAAEPPAQAVALPVDG